jgi:hypothetical protein
MWQFSALIARGDNITYSMLARMTRICDLPDRPAQHKVSDYVFVDGPRRHRDSSDGHEGKCKRRRFKKLV